MNDKVKYIMQAGMATCTFFLGMWMWEASIVGLNRGIIRLTPKPASIEEIVGRLDEVKQKLDCNKDIQVFISDKDIGRAFGDDLTKYMVVLGGDKVSISGLRHEVYHVCKDHLSYSQNGLVQLWLETMASSYTLKEILNDKRGKH